MLALKPAAMDTVAHARTGCRNKRANILPSRRAAPPIAMSGFTLLELMVTLSVLAILASLGVPAMQEMLERNRLKSAARALAEDLQWVRSEAIRRNRDLHLVIDDDSVWCYGVTDRTDCDCRLTDPNADDACTLSPPTEDDAPLLKRVGGADFAGVNARASFGEGLTGFEARRGTTMRMGSGAPGSERSGNGNVTFANARDERLRVVVSVIGRVRVCSPNQSVLGFSRCD
jgi:type IV fimbrial biogenesis protein FimT